VKVIHLDVETYSALDIKLGAYEYFRHKSTELLCACYEIGEENRGTFTPTVKGSWRKGDSSPRDLVKAIEEGVIVWAHNAEFEREAINHLTNWGHISVSQIRCTLALAACQSLPLSLDKLGKCLNIERKKDAEGKKVMMALCKPNKEGVKPEPTNEQMDILVEYCARDVEAEIDIGNMLLPYSQMQLDAYHATVKINHLGIPVDRELIQACQKARQELRNQADIRIKEITNGEHSIDMIMSPIQLMIWLTKKGVDIKNSQKQTIEDLLASDTELDAGVREVLEQRLIVSSASLKKFDVMEGTSESDGRIRGTIQFHAAFTGRWGGRLVQPQNLPRPVIKDLDSARGVVMDGGHVDVDTLKSLIRHSIKAPEGKEFICADWANIEGRMLAYLAGEKWKLMAFEDFDNGMGHDLYKLAYAKSFNISPDDVTSDQRAIGKVQELALGYGGGAGAIEAFAKDKFSMAEKENMKKSYRKANKNIERFWHDLESLAVKTVKLKSNKVFTLGKLKMKYSNNCLFIMLPSGRCIRYPIVKLRMTETPWGAEKEVLSYMKYDKGQWLRTETFGGKICENVVQGACACLMMEALSRFDNIIMSVHDEIVCEIDEGTGDLEEFEKEFSRVPEWAEGLPVSSEGWIGKEYRK